MLWLEAMHAGCYLDYTYDAGRRKKTPRVRISCRVLLYRQLHYRTLEETAMEFERVPDARLSVSLLKGASESRNLQGTASEQGSYIPHRFT